MARIIVFPGNRGSVVSEPERRGNPPYPSDGGTYLFGVPPTLFLLMPWLWAAMIALSFVTRQDDED